MQTNDYQSGPVDKWTDNSGVLKVFVVVVIFKMGDNRHDYHNISKVRYKTWALYSVIHCIGLIHNRRGSLDFLYFCMLSVAYICKNKHTL